MVPKLGEATPRVGGRISSDKMDLLRDVSEKLPWDEEEKDWVNDVHIKRMMKLGAKAGQGVKSVLAGKTRRTANQQLIGTISLSTFHWLLGQRRSAHGNVLNAMMPILKSSQVKSIKSQTHLILLCWIS